MPETPIHKFRVSDRLWNTAKRIASARSQSMTDVLRAGLRDYIAEHASAAVFDEYMATDPNPEADDTDQPAPARAAS